jgi:hypothetical protein
MGWKARLWRFHLPGVAIQQKYATVHPKPVALPNNAGY